MVFQSGALFDSLTVAENIAFPLEDQPGLDGDGCRRLCGQVSEDAGSGRSAGQSTQRTFHRHEARRGDCAGRWRRIPRRFSTTSPPPWWIRSWPAHMGDLILRLERNVPQNFHRGDARHASGQEAWRTRLCFCRTGELTSLRPGRISKTPKIRFCKISGCRMN